MSRTLVASLLLLAAASCAEPAEVAAPLSVLRICPLPDQSDDSLRDRYEPLCAYLTERLGVATELVLVAGDFNVDYFSNGIDKEFNQLTSVSNLVFADESPAPSYEKTSNTLVDEPVTERLDYIFYSDDHLAPSAASNQVLYFRHENRDLSDHHAIAGHFTTGTRK